MINDIQKLVNVVDVLMAFILLRGTYVGFQQGVLVEFFKIIGILLANFIAIHYFFEFTRLAGTSIPLPQDILQPLVFAVLWVFVVLIFAVVRNGWLMGFAPKEKKFFDKFFGAALGFLRGMVVCGLTFVLIFISGHSTLMSSARQSLSGFYLLGLSPYLYDQAFESGITKIFPDEVKNEKVFEYMTGEKKSAQ